MKILNVIFSLLFSHQALSVPLNCPYKNSDDSKLISYNHLTEYPENLDPILSYEAEKFFILSQIYEPLYTIAYQSNPQKLEPLIAASMPTIKFYDKQMHPVALNTKLPPAYTVYNIPIKPHLYYQPHPGFCKILHIQDCNYFKREVVADDFVYQIKRIAQLDSHSPFSSILNKYINGFSKYQHSKLVVKGGWHDLRADTIAGVRALNKYTLQITIKGHYTQWLYWMAMTFFTPMPWEIDVYHHLYPHNNRWGTYSIGTGPYMFFSKPDPQKITLLKNPHYRPDYFRFWDGLKKVPVIDEHIFNIEKESIPRWNKFLQGYYDYSNIPSESFQSNIQIQPNGKYILADTLLNHRVKLTQEPSSYSSGIVFNFLDPVVGGYSAANMKLRQAISIAYDFDEYRTIFRNGRGVVSESPIPPNFSQYLQTEMDYNKVLYQMVNEKKVKKSLAQAQNLLAEAGYPNGINPKTGHHLILNLDQASHGLPEEKAYFSWFRKQMNQLGIQLNIREYDTNRFTKKMLSGKTQLFFFTWGADYPDAENFLMLFYGPNQQAHLGGPNWANFKDSEYDSLYEKYRLLPDGPEKNMVIKNMIQILQQQAVWAWGMHSQNFYLVNHWFSAQSFDSFSTGLLKYFRLDVKQRQQSWQEWNRPALWIIVFFAALAFILIYPFMIENLRIKHRKPKRTLF